MGSNDRDVSVRAVRHVSGTGGVRGDHVTVRRLAELPAEQTCTIASTLETVPAVSQVDGDIPQDVKGIETEITSVSAPTSRSDSPGSGHDRYTTRIRTEIGESKDRSTDAAART